MTLDSWALLWKWVFFIGLTSFFVLVIVIIPLGWRDLVRLFAQLRAGGEGSALDAPVRRTDSTSPPPSAPPSQS